MIFFIIRLGRRVIYSVFVYAYVGSIKLSLISEKHRYQALFVGWLE